MPITEHPASAQRDPAEYVGLANPLPPIITFGDFRMTPPSRPEEIIHGVLHRGCKLILGGTSKSNKSWCLIDMAMSVSCGQPWWGLKTTQGKVLFVNFELQSWAMFHRIVEVQRARLECTELDDNLHVWNLRGHNADLSLLRPRLEQQLEEHDFSLIILDPAYKVLGDRDENANGEIAGLMNEFEKLAQKSGASVVLAHHFAKGDSSSKNAIDRMSGAGAWARDPDAIIVLSPHEEEDCFTVTPILRNHKPIAEFVVRWDFPRMMEAPELNPSALRSPQSKNKKCTDQEFLEACLPTKTPVKRADVVTIAMDKLSLSQPTVYRRIGQLLKAKLIRESGTMLVRI